MNTVQKNKKLLFNELCSRLPYRLKAYAKMSWGDEECVDIQYISEKGIVGIIYRDYSTTAWMSDIKPYLRPLSNMTEKEKDALLVSMVGNKHKHLFKIKKDGRVVEFDDREHKQWQNISDMTINWIDFCPKSIKIYTEFMYKHHIDFNDLIGKGLAIEAPEGMYKIK